jgi:hypothetical protein
MAAKKRVDPIKQREKRAKIAAVGGCVLLLGVGAFEIPKMMKLMHKQPVAPPPAAAQPTPGAAGALPDVSGGAAAPATSTPAGQLADTDVPLAAASAGQLVSFDVFETKNPFRPQVTASDSAPAAADAAAAPDTAATPSSGSASPTAPAPSAPAPVAVPSTPAPTPAPTATTPAAPPAASPAPAAANSVAISVNGNVSRVGRDGTFPAAKPVFRLVSWSGGHARIGIVGGSYSTGAPTLTLERGKPVTLQNTSDGQRYRLVLVSTP